jgi:Family of unknown function (DUF5681)
MREAHHRIGGLARHIAVCATDLDQHGTALQRTLARGLACSLFARHSDRLRGVVTRGGSRAQSARRARALALEEAYRLVTVREGNKVIRLPAIQAMMRNQLALAVKGNGPAQRAMLAAIDALEKETRGRGCGRGTGRGRAGPDQLHRWRTPDRVPFRGSLQGNGETNAGQSPRPDYGIARGRDAKDGK